jgi:hypothetical protein
MLPVQPRRNPAVSPTSVPISTAMPLATRPMNNDVRAP